MTIPCHRENGIQSSVYDKKGKELPCSGSHLVVSYGTLPESVANECYKLAIVRKKVRILTLYLAILTFFLAIVTLYLRIASL